MNTESKITCRECLEKFADMSADDVATAHAIAIRVHLAACPPCQKEWEYFEHTLFVLSSSTQPLPSSAATMAMWQGCSEHIYQKTESRRGAKASGIGGWVARQPRWGWLTLGGALAMLGAAWFYGPREEALNLLNEANNQSPITTMARRGGGPGELVMLGRPPAGALGLINNHTAMTADPLADNVGSTMVSYSATTPATAGSSPSVAPATSAVPAPVAPDIVPSTSGAFVPAPSTPATSAPDTSAPADMPSAANAAVPSSQETPSGQAIPSSQATPSSEAAPLATQR